MLAKLLDVFLILTVALTAALTLYKSLQLFLGERLLGRATPLTIANDHVLSEATRKDLIAEALERLETNMALMATIAAAAPFVGLMGTVLHIMEALSRISGASLDISLISGPIATALNSTLVGLASAVPAAIAYNLYSRRIQVMDNAARRALERRATEESEK